jgi:TRAP-type C4-dicarboxylate transport system substrate-binding protein
MKRMSLWLCLLLATVLLVSTLVGCSKEVSTTTKTAVSTTTATATTTTTQTSVKTATTTSIIQKVVIKFSTPGPAEHPGTIAMIDAAKKFNDAAGGRYEIKVYAGGALAVSLDQMNAIRTGAIDMGDAATNFYAGDSAAFGVMDVPFLFNNVDAQAAFGATAITTWNAVSEQKMNQKLLTTFVYGKKDVYTVNKQIKTLADWKGLLVSINTPLESDLVKSLGAAPVLIDWVDEIPSLQKGLINAGIISSLAGLINGYSDVIKYLTVCNRAGGLGFIAINLDTWKAMPKDIQDLMLKSWQDFTISFNKSFKQGEEVDWLQGIQKQGVTVYNLPVDERNKWITATKPVADGFWKGIPSDQAKALQDAAASANSKFPAK